MFKWIRTGSGKQSELVRMADDNQRVRRTTGLIEVPRAPNTTMNLYASSFTEQAVRVGFEVNRLTGSGRLEAVFNESVTVSPGRAGSLSFTAPAGETVEVTVTLPDSLDLRVVPSADVVQFFPADGATTPLITLPPGAFVPVPDATTPASRGHNASQKREGSDPSNAAPWLSSGLVDIPQGVAAIRPQARLLISNVTGRALTSEVVVNRLAPGGEAKIRLTERTITVPAGGGVALPLDDVEGLTVEVNVARPDEGLIFALSVSQLFLSDDTSQPIFRLRPDDFVAVPNAGRASE